MISLAARRGLGAVVLAAALCAWEGGDGLGHRIVQEQQQFDMPGVYAGILALGLLGYVLDRAFLAVEGRLLVWHHGAAGASVR